MQQPAPALTPNTVEAVAAIAVVATLAVSVAIVVGGILRGGLQSLLHSDTPRERALISGVVRLARIVTFLVLLAVLTFPALDIAGLSVPSALRSDQLWEWLAREGVRIVVITVLAAVLVRVTAAVAARAEEDLSAGTGLDAWERRKRARTIGGLVRRTLAFLIWTMAALIVLRELDVDITPVLTGAGIVGLAVGFGAQTLVRDVISGFFLIVEDQVRVGDVAEVNGTGGFVEQINLRTIVLRDAEGAVHVFPNGEIKTLANRTKDFSYYVLDLPVGYGDDTDAGVAAVHAAAHELVADPAWAPHILEPLEVLGVDAFGESHITLKFRIKTVPLKQWDVGRELRRRVKKAFDARGIKMPYKQLTIHFAKAPDASVTDPRGE
ncbi:MAG: mechanosensitive ion channel family protein [Vicinamibacterales bacterium]